MLSNPKYHTGMLQKYCQTYFSFKGGFNPLATLKLTSKQSRNMNLFLTS